MQYAGSVGFFSFGYYKQTPNDKVGIGIVYGKTPKQLGGPLTSISLKVRYSPFKIKLYNQLYLEPFQTGFFLSQNFGKNLEFNWPDQYPKGYYWWGNSFRQHFFFSSQISIMPWKGYFNKISLYMEANTNDLYLYSYFPNRKTLSPYDILFLGIGIKFYVRNNIE